MNYSISSTNLDFRGMQCPQPIIATAKAARALGGKAGTFVIMADDESFPMDLKSWVSSARAELRSLDQTPQGYRAEVVVNPHAEPQIAAPLPTPQRVPQRVPQVTPAQAQPSLVELDCRGMQCPQPIIKLAKMMRDLPPNMSVRVLADDESFPMDVRSWVKGVDMELLSLENQNGIFEAMIGSKLATKQVQAAAVAKAPVATAPAPSAPSKAPAKAHTDEMVLTLEGLAPKQIERKLQALDTLDLAAGTGIRFTLSGVQDTPLLTQWVATRGHHIIELDTRQSPFVARVELAEATSATSHTSSSTALVPQEKPQQKKCTLLVLHNDMEALLAALMVGTGAATQGMDVVMFFTFWGVNLLRGDRPNVDVPKERISLPQRMFKWMMPKGARRQSLGQLNFGGMGRMMLGRIMKQRNIMSLDDLVASAVDLDVKFIVCTMSMGVMGITKRDLVVLPNMEFAGVATFVGEAAKSEMSMVF